MNEKPLVILIEDDEDDAKNYKDIIEQALEVTVEILHPLPRSIQDLVVQVGSASPSAIIIDERLPVRSDAEYNGIDVADHLRNNDMNIPIVILTNYPNDQALLNREFLADMIWDKMKFDEDERIYLERFARWIGGLMVKRKTEEKILTLLESRIKDELSKSGDISENLMRIVAALHLYSEPGLELIVWLKSDVEDEIRLIEINTATTPTGSIEVFSIPPSDLLPFRMKIADVAPSEWRSIQSGEVGLPSGWTLEDSNEFDIEVLNEVTK